MFTMRIDYAYKPTCGLGEVTGCEDNANFSFTFPDQPSWDELTSKFLGVLKSAGYVFDYDAQLGIIHEGEEVATVDDTVPFDNEVDLSNEIVGRKRKSKKKT